jgi:hypothetical protein
MGGMEVMSDMAKGMAHVLGGGEIGSEVRKRK